MPGSSQNHPFYDAHVAFVFVPIDKLDRYGTVPCRTLLRSSNQTLVAIENVSECKLQFI